MPFESIGAQSPVLDATTLSRLRWRCRRGLLENDLFVERFFDRYQATMTHAQALGLQALMDLADNDLLDLLLARTELTGELARPEVAEVLQLMRTPDLPTFKTYLKELQ